MIEASNPQVDSVSKTDERRKAYQVPVLTVFGDVRQLTLGGSPGTGDSGSPGTQEF